MSEERTEQAKQPVCEYCGCCEDAPCSLCRQNGTEGFFYNLLRTCCVADPCVRLWEQAKRDAIRSADAQSLPMRRATAEKFRKAAAAKREKLFKKVSRARRLKAKGRA